MVSDGSGGIQPRVALIDTGNLNRVAGHPLHLGGQRRDLLTSTPVGRRDRQRWQVAERVDRDMDL